MGGDAERALEEVIRQFGRVLVARPDRLRAALSDIFPTDSQTAPGIDELVAVSETGVAADLSSRPDAAVLSRAEVEGWFDRLLAAGLSRADALWATNIWAQVLGPQERALEVSEISRTLTAPTEPMLDDLTVVSDVPSPGSGDLTVITPPTPPQTPDPESPEDPPMPETPAPPARARDGLSTYWPSLAAAAVTVVALAVGGPLIASRTATADPPPFDPVQTVSADGYERRDIAQFALSADELTAFVPGATESADPASRYDGYHVGFTAEKPGCESVLMVDLPVLGPPTVLRASYAYDRTDPWLWIDSVTRRYETAEDANLALTSMTPPGACASFAADNNGTEFTVDVTVSTSRLVSGVRVEHIRAATRSSPSWVLERSCYLVENVVSCVVVSGTDTDGLGSIGGRTLQGHLDKRMTTITPFREQS